MLRVLQVLDKISVDSGASIVVMNYYKALEQKRLTFDFMLNEEPNVETRAFIESKGSKIYIMPALKTGNTFKYIKALKTFYKEHEYQIIHGHVANSAVFYFGRARKTARHRIIHSHNTRSSDNFIKRIRNFALTRFIKNVATDYMACSKVAADFLFGKKNSAIILNNAVDIVKFSYNPEKRDSIKTSLNTGDKKVIGHIGRFSTQKNHKFLIDFFFELTKTNKNALLLLIGSGDLYDSIKQKVREKGIEDKVRFTGIVDNAHEYLSAMDVFVLPSLFEGLPMTGVEAQINGLPCIFSDAVTRETQISDNTKFLPIDKTKLWVDETNRMLGIGRIENKDINTDNFNINIQVEKLTSYYEGLVRL